MRTITLKVKISGVKNTEHKYYLNIHYVEGNLDFNCTNDGKGFSLPEVQHYAFVLHRMIKPQLELSKQEWATFN